MAFDLEIPDGTGATLIFALGIVSIASVFGRDRSNDDAKLPSTSAKALYGGIVATCVLAFYELYYGYLDLKLVCAHLIMLLSTADGMQIILSGQATVVLTEKRYKQRSRACLHGVAICCISLVRTSVPTPTRISAILVLLCAFLSIPRRQDEFIDGVLVDRENTSSLLEWISFSWGSSAFNEASTVLPSIPMHMRTAACARWYAERKNQQDSFTRAMLKRFSRPIMLQWVLTIANAAASTAPRYVTYKLLQHLQVESPSSTQGLWLAVALSSCHFLHTWLSSRIEWMTRTQLMNASQGITMSLISDKCLRIPNVIKKETKEGKTGKTLFAHMRTNG